MDSKGRICIPVEIREEIGDTATIKKTQEGYLIISAKHQDVNEELLKIVNSEYRRTGKPENWSPEEMKSIWKPKPEFVKETTELRKQGKFVKIKDFAEEFDLK